jgi:hypothetical protein
MALKKIMDYGDDHNWGTIPVGKTIEDVRSILNG